MATLLLTKRWLNLIPTGEAIAAYSSSRSRSDEIEGRVETYAGGRRRAIVSEGVGTTVGFTLRQLTYANIETLISWIGKTVQDRDHLGQRFFGVFMQVVPVEVPNQPTAWDAQIELRTVTYDEAV